MLLEIVNKIHYVNFSAGAMYLCLQCGSWSEMKTIFNLHHNIKGAGGTSAGALMALGVCLNYTEEEFKDLLFTYDLSRVWDEASYLNAPTNYGINDRECLFDLIQIVLEKKLGCKQITYKEFFEQTGKDLKVVCANVTKMKKEIDCKDICPDRDVAESIVTSMSIPGLFYPTQRNNEFIVDGGCIETISFDLFPFDETLFFCYKEIFDKSEISSITQYISRCISCGSQTKLQEFSERLNEEQKHHLLWIPVPEYGIAFDFSMPSEKKQQLFQVGKTYIKNHILKEVSILYTCINTLSNKFKK